MLKNLKNLIDQLTSQDQMPLSQPALEQVTAALLIQLARVDQSIDDNELSVVEDYITSTFHLTKEQVSEVVEAASRTAERATSLYEFTSQIHESCTPSQKYQIIVNLWRVAYADGELDKYEEHFIRKASELLYVPHPEFIRAKLEVTGG
ncbi:TerB family tellurite resistance protein [Hahella ganghwensis]|uniref:tellurite resistance TerB family protein n=1 Tax=Hahella ganghwensis TaxID=286420 RepID=UPI00036A014A|nr:TerB family tellurite resistance protein [Hahella ganghwensis]